MKYQMKIVLIISLLVLTSCSAVRNKTSNAEPVVSSLGSDKFDIKFYVEDAQAAGPKLEKLATEACKGRKYDISNYVVKDNYPVYVHVSTMVTCI